MQRDLMDVICCPTCKADLTLKVDREDAGDIVTGTLTCVQCGHVYPIDDGIPNLLPPELAEDEGG